MNILVKGHSGCQIDVVSENNILCIYKSSTDPQYLNRLALQLEKQSKASALVVPHIRVPKLYSLSSTSEATVGIMEYVYSKNFIEFLEQAGFEQIDYFIEAMQQLIDYEVTHSTLEKITPSVFQDKFEEIFNKVEHNPLYKNDTEARELLNRCRELFNQLSDMILPIGMCHGDLTLSNILFNGNNYYLIDFLDSFIETPLQDIVKLRQDTAYQWSQLMYTKNFDSIRLQIISKKIDDEIDSFFANKYEWYRDNYKTMQLMNILRILPYAKEEKVIHHLKKILTSLLHD
ncbi:MAG: phosphotransferase [Rikenellaceae bacterium]